MIVEKIRSVVGNKITMNAGPQPMDSGEVDNYEGLSDGKKRWEQWACMCNASVAMGGATWPESAQRKAKAKGRLRRLAKGQQGHP